MCRTPLTVAPKMTLMTTRRWYSTPDPAAGAAEGLYCKVTFSAKTEDGTVIAGEKEPEVAEFIMGKGQMMPGMEKGCVGMKQGETKTLTVAPEDAFGTHSDDMVVKVPKSRLPEDVKVGNELQSEQGVPVIVKALEGEEATIDGNHPLAGKTLTIELKLEECRAPTAEEDAIGQEPQPEQLGGGLVKVTRVPGDGKTFPTRGAKLSMHYTGVLAKDGKKFDSSRDRGQPFTFTIGVGQVIQGWDQGVMKMSLGERAELHIPSQMGYGAQGAGGAIPPNADLIFDVELLKIG